MGEGLTYGIPHLEMENPSHSLQTKPVVFLLYIHVIYTDRLEEAKTANYLGVTIQNGLNWNKHIDATTKKVSNIRAFLQGNIKQCPGKTKEICYKTLVRSTLEYDSVIWDLFTDDNIRKLEIVQRRAARTVFSDYTSTSSVTSMCNSSSGPSFRSSELRKRYT